MIHNKKDLIQLMRLTEDIQIDYPIPRTEKDALNYLYFLDRTYFDNSYSSDLVDYEKLIYIEYNFSQNKTIQQLLKNIKENISNNYLLKYKYIARLTDDLYINEINKRYSDRGIVTASEDRYLMLRGSEDCEYVI